MLHSLERHRRLVTLIICALALVCGFGISALTEPAQPNSSGPKSFVMGHTAGRQDPFSCWQTQIYQRALSSLGYTLIHKNAPLARAAAMAESGDIDGIMSRSAGYWKTHPDLVKVEEPLCAMRFVAITNLPDVHFCDAKALAGFTHTVAHLRGDEVTVETLGTNAPGVHTIAVNTHKSGFRMLAADRVQVLIIPEPVADKLLHSPEFRDAGCRKAGLIHSTTFHAYLHPRHANLAKQISTTLKAMKRAGLPQQFARECGYEYYTPAPVDTGPSQ